MNQQPAYTFGSELFDIIDSNGLVRYRMCLPIADSRGEVFAYGWRTGGFVDTYKMRRRNWTVRAMVAPSGA